MTVQVVMVTEVSPEVFVPSVLQVRVRDMRLTLCKRSHCSEGLGRSRLAFLVLADPFSRLILEG